MKRILLSMMTLGAISMMAQSSSEYVPLVREGVKWDCAIIQYRPDDTMSEYPYTIEFRGDTTINEKTYKKCYYFFDGHTQEECDSTLRAFVREDIATRQVWALNNPGYLSNDDVKSYWGRCSFLDYGPFTATESSEDEERLIYDFYDITSEDVLKIGAFLRENTQSFSIETDTMDIAGVKTPATSVLMNYYTGGYGKMYFIEGIGSDSDLLNVINVNMIADMHSWAATFYRLRNADGEVIYSAPADPENEYVQLLNETQTWEGAIIDDNGWTGECKAIPHKMKIKGDTIINGRGYKKCYYYWYNDTTIEDNSTLVAFLRENHCMRTVFAVPNDEFSAPNDTIQWCVVDWLGEDYLGGSHLFNGNGEVVLYSFNDITAPDVYRIGRYYEGAIDNIAIDKVVIDNIERKRYISTFISGLTVIEGLGYVGYQNNAAGACDFFNPSPVFVTGGHDRYSRLYRVKNAAGEVIYRTNYDKDNSVSSIIADESIATIDIYNIQGVLLMQGVAPAAVNNLDAGLYIVKSYNAAGDSVKTSKVIIGNSINSTN